MKKLICIFVLGLLLGGNTYGKIDWKKRNRFNFAQIGIEVGEVLEFKKDKSIKAKVLENDLIEFRGKPMSLSQSALEIVQEMGYTWNKIAGPQFWMYKGKTLYELNQ